MDKTAPHRRRFLQSAGAAAAVGMATPALAQSNSKIVVGLIGAGGMGSAHLRSLSARDDVEVARVCDVDQQRLAKAGELVRSVSGREPQRVGDLREVLDDERIDAVFIATPDHWHAPAAILALDAGKHVYVEKPCCHNVREGRLMAEAVRRSGKRLQIGTQSRSTAMVQEAIAHIRDGKIGEVLAAKAWNSQRRGSIGKSKPAAPPPHLDFDNWLGPAPTVEYRPNMLHAIWRWWEAFGCGDIGNDGVHDIDVALWGLGVDTHPERIACLGRKLFFDDDQQWPDTQYAVMQYPGPQHRQFVYEQRIWSPYPQEGYENGAAFYGTEGHLVLGHTIGYRLYGRRDKLLAEGRGRADLVAHHNNFFECLRDPSAKLNADIQAGHLSATVVHLANIGFLTGRVLHFDPEREVIVGDDEAHQRLRRRYRSHWATPDA